MDEFFTKVSCFLGDMLTMSDESEDEETLPNNDLTVKRIVSKWKRRNKVMLAKSRLLRRKSTKQKRNILERHPEIGEVMEKYAEACDVGADRWRRTGLLTFGGDQKKEKRLTYRRLQEYLKTYYGEHISLGWYTTCPLSSFVAGLVCPGLSYHVSNVISPTKYHRRG